MKRLKDNNPFWIVLIIILFLTVLVTSILAKVYGKCLPDWIHFVNVVAAGLASILSFWRGSYSHKKQIEKLEEIKTTQESQITSLNEIKSAQESEISSLNMIYDIVSSSSMLFDGNVQMSRPKCHAYVKVILYAMYQSYKRTAIDYKLINPDNPRLTRVLISVIAASFKSDALTCNFGDDDCLIVDTFDKEKMQVTTDGQDLVSNYEHYSNYDFVKSAVRRINQACGIIEHYTD